MAIARIENLDQLEEMTDTQEYCRKVLGLDVPETTGLATTIPCPLPHDHDESAKLIIYRNGRVCCTSYGEPTSIWNLAMVAEGLTFPKAVERVCKFFGISDKISRKDSTLS